MPSFHTVVRCPKCDSTVVAQLLIELRMIEGDSDMGSATVQCFQCGHLHTVAIGFDVVVGKRFSR